MTAAISTRPAAPCLSRYVTEIPKKIQVEQERKAVLYNLASKVCFAALIAIATSTLAISVGLLAPIHPALMLGLVLSTAFLQSYFTGHLAEYSMQAIEAKEKAKELERIQNWTGREVQSFFKEHKLSLDKLPMDLLRRLEPKDPLRALLPAIANYIYLCGQTKIHLDEHLKNLHNEIKDHALHHRARQIGWHLLEYNAIPTALEAALVLQIISQPTVHLKLEELGICHAKEFDERRFDQLLDGTDEYFVFHEKSRPTLTFAKAHEMVANQNIDALRVNLFA